MRIWLALIVAPLLALADQLVAASLVPWACAHQSVAVVHGSHAIFLALASGAAVIAWLRWRETGIVPVSTGEGAFQIHFLAGVAMVVASLSALAIAAMWIPTWMISSCFA